jgi:hypothetical protein
MARAGLVSVGSLLLVGVLGTSAFASTTVYVNGDPGAVTGGWDDSAHDVSSIAWGTDGEIAVPGWAGSKKRWRAVVECVRDRFADFAVVIVTDRPSGGEYIMIMVGGQPSLFGYGDGVGGVAPYTGEVMRSAIGYVFAAASDFDVEQTCVAILHETGHTLGLDHAYLCPDPMSYLWGCGEKTWQDEEAPCGENEERTCGNGEEAQNSYQLLAANVGLRDHVVEEEEPAPVAPTAPTISIDDPGDEMIGNGWIQIEVRAASDAGVAEVELGWASETAQYLFACGSIADDEPAQCTRDGDVFRFSLYVGVGERAMAARVTDGNGNQAVTDTRLLTLY